MNRISLILVFSICSLPLFSQTVMRKFFMNNFYGYSGIGIFKPENKNSDLNGKIILHGALGGKFDRNIFLLNYEYLGIYGDMGQNFYMSYGREILKANQLSLEIETGLGYANMKSPGVLVCPGININYHIKKYIILFKTQYYFVRYDTNKPTYINVPGNFLGLKLAVGYLGE